MRRWIKATLVATGVTLAIIQIVRPSRTNPPEQPGRSIHLVASVDPAVRRVFERSCNDCHSNSTIWPWYSHVAPVSWIVAGDVHRGRRALNLSDWGGYTPKQQTELLQDMCEEVSQGEMPDALYVTMHGKARLNAAEKQQLCDWVHRMAGATNPTKAHRAEATPLQDD